MSVADLKPHLEKILQHIPGTITFYETTFITASVTRSIKEPLMDLKCNVRGYDTCIYKGIKRVSWFRECLDPLYEEFEGKGKFIPEDLKRCFEIDESQFQFNNYNVFVLDPFNLATLYSFNRLARSCLKHTDKVILIYNSCEIRQPGGAQRHATNILGECECVGKIKYEKRFGKHGANREWSIWTPTTFTF